MQRPENANEIPDADAVEQRQEIAAPPPDAEDHGSPPIEADAADWQQQQAVAGFDEADEAPRREDDYPEGW